MHLGQACVDLQGNFVCDGSLEFSPDDGGKFEHMGSTQVVIDRDGMTIANCRATRHASGFFESVSSGAVLAMPQSLVALIKDALRFGVKQTVKATVEGQHGALMSSSSTLHHYTQPLSDWELVISERSSCIYVEISAELFGAHILDWMDSEDNFWQSRGHVSARFSFDPITRAACFRAYVADLDVPEDGTAPTAALPIGNSLNLAGATVGLSNNFGIDGKRSIHVGFGSGLGSYLTFTEHSHVYRLPGGFLSHGYYEWPRAWFFGVQLEILAALDERPITFSGPGLRAFAAGGSGEDSWHEDASEASLELSLAENGLTMTYAMTTANRQLNQTVILPWEVLLLRLPKLGSSWSKIIAA